MVMYLAAGGRPFRAVARWQIRGRDRGLDRRRESPVPGTITQHSHARGGSRMRNSVAAALVLAIAVGAGTARAQTITPGFTFAVASDVACSANGTHFHSNTGGVFGNPAGKAEVGNFFSECVRGLSEYDLTGLAVAPTAFVTFNVFDDAGLFAGINDFPFAGTIDVVAYAGNSVEDFGDYEAAAIGTVGSFGTAGLAVGDVLSFDIAAIFNAAIGGGQTSLGIRLQRAGESGANTGAWTFDTFRLTVDDQSTGVVPEPGTWVLMATGLGVIGLVARRR